MKISKALPLFLKALLVFVFALCSGSLANAATNLPFDQVTPGTIASAAQSENYTFSANANDILNFTVVATSSTSGTLGPCIVLYDPSNTQVDSAGGNYSQDVEMNGYKAAVSGTYTVLIKDCADVATGNYLVFLQKANNPVGAVALPFASVQAATIGSEAQSVAYTLTANANDVLNFTVSTTKLTTGTLGPCIFIYNTTATQPLDSAGGNFAQQVEMNGFKVPATGTYNVFIRDCADTATGNFDLFVQKANNPIASVAGLYGQLQSGTIGSATQSNAYTLIGTLNDVLNFTVTTTKSTAGTLGPCIFIYNTTATQPLDSAGGNYAQQVEMNSFKVPATGTYNVFIKDCVDTATGTYNLQTDCLGTCALPAPVISSISPSSALAGSSGFTLTVNGSNFVNVNANSVVQWNGADLTTTFVNTGQLTALVPVTDIALAEDVPITVFTPAPGGGTSNSKTFAVDNPKPTLTTILPTSATAGGAAFTLTVNGTGFNSQSVAYWNTVALPTTLVSSTQVTAAVPASDIAAAGTASVTVTNPTPAGGTTTSATFTIDNPSPVLTKISPTTITAGNSSATTVTLTGTGFVSTSTVDWTQTSPSAQPAVGLATTYVSSTQLTASVPTPDTACGASANIAVVNPSPVNSPGTSTALAFTANDPVPTLTSISPTNIAAGSASFTLTVNGSKFLKSCSVIQWNGSSLATTFVSATQLTATIPASDVASNATATVTVNNPAPGGGTTASQPFTVGPFPVPVLTSISPTSATAGGVAFTLTLNGSSFVQNSAVYWNGVALPITYVSSIKLTAAVPASDIATAGADPVTVQNPTPGGGPANPGQTFTVNNPLPTATSIVPTSIPAAGAKFTLTVNGSNFVSTAIVLWNGSGLATAVVSASQLTATVPAADIATTGTASVTVMNPTPGGGTSSPALTFTIENPLAATPIISPPAGSYGYGVLVSITEPVATPGATIYYSTDGTTPSSTSSTSRKYTSPFLFVGPATAQAIAVAPNFTNSAIASSAYVVDGSPTVLDLPAISVTSSAGTIRSDVSGHNLAGQVWFVYGTSPTALTLTTPQQALAAAAPGVTFQAPLTGLIANTIYYFQAVSTTPGGTSSGAILSFTTP